MLAVLEGEAALSRVDLLEGARDAVRAAVMDELEEKT